MKRTVNILADKGIYLFSLSCLLIYLVSYFYRWEIGLVKPSANLRYFYFSQHESVELMFRAAYYPLYRIHYWPQEQNGIPNEIYFSERQD